MNARSILSAACAAALLSAPAEAGFHFMQIEQIVGGISGDPTAQAVQLRMRSGGQNLVQNSSLWAWDAAGANRILLLNIASSVSSSAAGSRVLLTTPSFTSTMIAAGATTFSPDFTLANAIPASYLTAGRLTFENDSGTVSTPGTIYWSLSWGGSGYTGSNSGATTNDTDGNFGPSFGSALPTSSAQGIRFTGAANALSTTNAANYALTANPATVTKNNGLAFVIVPEPGTAALLAALALGAFAIARRRA